MDTRQVILFIISILADAMLLWPLVQSASTAELINQLRNTTTSQDANITPGLNTNFTTSSTTDAPVYANFRGSCDTDAECRVIALNLFCTFNEEFNTKMCGCEDNYDYKDQICVSRSELMPDYVMPVVLTIFIVLPILALAIAICIVRRRPLGQNDDKPQPFNTIYTIYFQD